MKTGSDSTLFRIRKFDPKWVFGAISFLIFGGGATWLLSCGRDGAAYLVEPVIHRNMEAMEKKIDSQRDSAIAVSMTPMMAEIKKLQEYVKRLPGGEAAAEQYEQDSIESARPFNRPKWRHDGRLRAN